MNLGNFRKGDYDNEHKKIFISEFKQTWNEQKERDEMPDLYRTISGALFRAPNLEHNNRDHIPWNAVQERADRNVILVIKCQVFLYKKSYIIMYNYSDAWI